MSKIVEQWLLFEYVGLEFTPLSKPFKTREQAEKAREIFQSLSYEGLRLPGHSATIIRKYRIGPDGSLLPLDNDQPEVIPHP